MLSACAASPEVWDINTVCFLCGFPKGTENVIFNWLFHVFSSLVKQQTDTVMKWERASVVESWGTRAAQEKRAASTCSSHLRGMLRGGGLQAYSNPKNNKTKQYLRSLYWEEPPFVAFSYTLPPLQSSPSRAFWGYCSKNSSDYSFSPSCSFRSE